MNESPDTTPAPDVDDDTQIVEMSDDEAAAAEQAAAAVPVDATAPDEDPDADGPNAIDDPEGGQEPDDGDPDENGVPAAVGAVAIMEGDDADVVNPPDDEADCGDAADQGDDGDHVGLAAYVGGGFLVSESTSQIGVKTYVVPGIDTKISVAVRSDIAAILLYVMAQFHKRVERLHVGWCWGYAYRAVRGSARPSFHSAGVAVDCNAPRHPLGTGVSTTYNSRQVAQIRAILREVGGTVRWGGDYSGRKDSMHFEVIAAPATARAVAARLSKPPAAPAKPPAKPPVKPAPKVTLNRVLKWTDSRHLITGSVVGVVQRIVGAAVDNKYGPATAAHVAAWQRKHGLSADGAVGPRTAARLGILWTGK